MKNIPNRIFLDVGYQHSDLDEDFNDLNEVTWSEDNDSGYGIEYVLKESMLPELSEEEWRTLMPILTRLTKPKINDILILSKLINNALEQRERNR